MAPASALFRTEAELCQAFIASVDAKQWRIYAETAGWDLLLSRRRDGFQIGVQAKLRLNAAVITQALDDHGEVCAGRPGPDCRAVLVPTSSGFERICAYLGLVILAPRRRYRTKWHFTPKLPQAPPAPDLNVWPEWAPSSRHELPEYIPDVVAGSRSPVRLTDWKIKALKLSALLEENGAVTRADFKHLGLDHRRWVEGHWLKVENGRLLKGKRWPDFPGQHPRVYQEIRDSRDRWMSASAQTSRDADAAKA